MKTEGCDYDEALKSISFFYGLCVIWSKKCLSTPRFQRFYTIFSSRSFSVLGFIFNSKIHFELIFRQVKNMDCIYLPIYLSLTLSLSLSLHLHPVCYLDLWILAALAFFLKYQTLLSPQLRENQPLVGPSVSSVWKPSLHIVCLPYLLFKESFYWLSGNLFPFHSSWPKWRLSKLTLRSSFHLGCFSFLSNIGPSKSSLNWSLEYSHKVQLD